MRWALHSGTMPTLRRWVDAGTHILRQWTVQLPCTTPASQQALLKGTSEGIPAFRWYDRELGRVLVANRPEDAAIIEARASTGRGLLADDGISISNIFTGDAPRASMTISRLEVTRGSRHTRLVFARFLLRPDGLFRSFSRTIAEIARERFQAMHQRRLAVVPRVHRSWTFAALRAFSNGLLRDLNTAIVAREMMRGTRTSTSITSTTTRSPTTRVPPGSKSVAVLGGLDHVLAVLKKVFAQGAPRPYDFVLLSDHGQSLGDPFAAKYGTGLCGLCPRAHPLARPPESRTTSRAGGGSTRCSKTCPVRTLPRPASQTLCRRRRSSDLAIRCKPGPRTPRPSWWCLAAGTSVWSTYRGPERVLLKDLEQRWPRLISGLVQHPGIGFVSVLSADGPLVIGAAGRHHLATGIVDGDDPLVPYGDHAAEMLAWPPSRIRRLPSST